LKKLRYNWCVYIEIKNSGKKGVLVPVVNLKALL